MQAPTWTPDVAEIPAAVQPGRGPDRAASPAPTAGVAGRQQRLVFVDMARAIAVLMMVQGHALHVLLEPSWTDNAVYRGWLHIRGLTSPTFLFLAGVTFSVIAARRWQAQSRAAVARRVARFVSFILLGYLLHFPVRGLARLSELSAARWDSFFQVDILQTIGLTMLLLQLLILVARTPRRFAVAALALGMTVLALSPIVRTADWYDGLWPPVAAYLTSSRGSLFPPFGWASPLLIGAAVGIPLATLHASQPLRVPGVLAALGGGTLLLGLVMSLLPPAIYPRSPPWEAHADFMVVRLGGVLLMLAAVARLTRHSKRLAAPLQALAEESLTVYFVHICLVYGSIWSPGLLHWYRGTLGPLGTGLAIVVLLGSMVLLTFYWNRFKKGHPRGTRLVRVAIAAALIIPLL